MSFQKWNSLFIEAQTIPCRDKVCVNLEYGVGRQHLKQCDSTGGHLEICGGIFACHEPWQQWWFSVVEGQGY